MSRACCCSVNHADVISSITTIQDGQDAIECAKLWQEYSMSEDHPDTTYYNTVLEQVVSECDGEWWYTCVIVCGK